MKKSLSSYSVCSRMFNCIACNRLLIVDSFQDIQKHISLHVHYGEIHFPVSCGQSPDCKSTYSTLWNYMRHIKVHLSSTFLLEGTEFDERNEDAVINEGGIIHDSDLEFNEDSSPIEAPLLELGDEAIVDIRDSLSNDVFNFVLFLRSKSAIPYTSCMSILGLLESLIKKLVKSFSEILETKFKAISDVLSIPGVVTTTIIELEAINSIFLGFKSEYQIKQRYKTHPLYVPPKSVVVGKRVESKVTMSGLRMREVVDTAQIVSITDTCKGLLKLTSFCDAIFESERMAAEEKMFTRFQDGTRFKSFPAPLSCDENQKSLIIYIQLFSDGLGTTNPLSPAAKNQNVMNYYFLVLNLIPKHYASLENIYLVACCKSVFIAHKAGQDALLQVIVDELLELETIGFSATIPNRGDYKIFVRLGQFTADNLALNQNFGLIEGFNSDFCCALCYSSKAERQISFTEDCFTLRTPEAHKNDLTDLMESSRDLNNVRGVKYDSPFNQLPYYHIMENFVNDVMHTALEGIGPCVTSLMLSSVIQEGWITIDEINDDVQRIYCLSSIERANKPTDASYSCGKVTFRMSSAQMWGFIRLLPLSIGHRIPQESECWLLFLTLEEIFDIIFAPKISDSSLMYFEKLYSQFLELFKKLYPGESIKPKMHFLVHFPTIVRKNGPMRFFWAMNFERMNGRFKIPTHTMNNFKNVAFTLAHKHQYASLEKITSINFLNSKCEIPKAFTMLSTSNYPEINFSLFISEPGKTSIAVTNIVFVNGIKYKKGYFVVLERSHEGDFVFGQIESIVCEDVDCPVLIVSVYVTKFFEQHIFCYCVERSIPAETRLFPINNLLDYAPLDCFELKNYLYIRLKHGILC